MTSRRLGTGEGSKVKARAFAGDVSPIEAKLRAFVGDVSAIGNRRGFNSKGLSLRWRFPIAES